jgi:hypothetical protein
MKKLLILASLLTTLNAYADIVLPTKCTPSDLHSLQAARSLELPTLELVIKDDIIPNIKSCTLTVPTNYYPAVCGQRVKQSHFYEIELQSGRTVYATTSISYHQCMHTRAYLLLEKITLAPIN